MANVCNNHLVITGDQKQLDELRDKIVAQDPDLLKIFTWFEPMSKEGTYYGMVQDPEDEEIYEQSPVISLDYTSKWRPDWDSLNKLSQAYPALHIENKYEENGNGLYGLATYEDGGQIGDERYTLEEFLQEDAQYQADVKEIQTMDYDGFLETYVEQMREQTLEYFLSDCGWTHLMETHILKRIKREDLPLIMDYDWHTIANRKLFERLLKGESYEEIIGKGHDNKNSSESSGIHSES